MRTPALRSKETQTRTRTRTRTSTTAVSRYILLGQTRKWHSPQLYGAKRGDGDSGNGDSSRQHHHHHKVISSPARRAPTRLSYLPERKYAPLGDATWPHRGSADLSSVVRARARITGTGRTRNLQGARHARVSSHGSKEELKQERTKVAGGKGPLTRCGGPSPAPRTQLDVPWSPDTRTCGHVHGFTNRWVGYLKISGGSSRQTAQR